MALSREPVVHFLVAGAILFAAFAAYRGDVSTDDAQTIRVDRRALLSFLQYRANAFDSEAFGAALDGMSDSELNDVIDAYVDEEILFREAEALGLDETDNIIRQRMVQKMTFLMADVAATNSTVDAETIEVFFEENIEDYAIDPWATFSHVFFDADKRGAESALADAEEAKRELNARGALFNDAPGMGDNFPFLTNYVERTFAYLAGHFGYDFVGQIETLVPSDSEWQGPFGSVFGQHVILLTHRGERSFPELDDVRGTVERDLANELSSQALTEMTRSIRDRYAIEIDEIRSGPGQ